jgi:hypothetical protein
VGGWGGAAKVAAEATARVALEPAEVADLCP